MSFSIILGLAFITTVVYIILKQQKPEIATLVLIAGGILLITYLLDVAVPIFSSLSDIVNRAGIDIDLAKIPVKALGIAIITQLAGDVCRDAGTSSVATKVEIAGKIAILILTVPLFEEILEIAIGLIQR